MRYPRIGLQVSEAQHLLTQSLQALRAELELSAEFPAEALQTAQYAVAHQPMPVLDLTGLGFVTIDPPASTDLDQALFLARHGEGYRAWYAIADVPSLVPPGSALDAQTRVRGQTMYAPDGRIPLHPDIIGEHAGSLLADQLRSAYVWDFELDAGAHVLRAGVRRARIRSRAKLNYEQVQQDIDSGDAAETLMLLKEIGLKRVELERQRGGASLNMPEQEIVHDGERYFVVSRPPLPVEDWNAQISLLTGMAAAQMMLNGRVGILRTMPPPDERAEAQFRYQTEALGHHWDEGMAYGEYLRSLDTSQPRQLALMHAAGSLFRGAGYTPFDGEVPGEIIQSAIAAPYAHATAPLRRLVDRFVLVICEALCAGRQVPHWAREALPELPKLMAASDQVAAKLERGAMDAVEAAVLSNYIGHEFDAVVIAGSRNGNGNGNGNGKQNGYKPSGLIQLANPAATARCDGVMETGTRVRVKLVSADIVKRETRFELVDAPQPAMQPGNAPRQPGNATQLGISG